MGLGILFNTQETISIDRLRNPDIKSIQNNSTQFQSKNVHGLVWVCLKF